MREGGNPDKLWKRISNFSLTWSISLHISHLDEAVGGLLDVVVAVAEDVQEKVLLDGWKDALQVPGRRITRCKVHDFLTNSFLTN